MVNIKQGHKRKSALTMQTISYAATKTLKRESLREELYQIHVLAYEEDIMLLKPEKNLKVDAAARLLEQSDKLQYPRDGE